MQHNFYKPTFQQYALQTKMQMQPHDIKWSATPTESPVWSRVSWTEMQT